MPEVNTGAKIQVPWIQTGLHHREFTYIPHHRRLCKDDRNYILQPYTIVGNITVTDYEPMWRVDRDYYIAIITATVGKHDTSTHPNDGTPGGQPIRLNLRRITQDQNTDAPILIHDGVLQIEPNRHRDVADDPTLDNSNNGFAAGLLNITKLFTGEFVYVRVSQVGTTRPGRNMVVTMTLAPVR